MLRFFHIQDKDKRIEAKLLDCFKNKKYPALEALIINSDTETLIRLALVNPEIDTICKLPCFNHYWKNIWRRCGLNPSEEACLNHKPIQEYLPIVTIASCFDLIKGYYLYEAYRKIISKESFSNQVAEEYLTASAQLGCYYALNALCKSGLMSLKKNFNDEVAIKTLTYAMVAADLYFSPGYLLLANFYQECLQFQDMSFFVGQNLRLEAFKAVNVAKRLQEKSTAMINNAYQGRTLLEASRGVITSFEQAEMRLQNLLNLTPQELSIAMEKARMEVSSINRLFPEGLDYETSAGLKPTPVASFKF